MLRLLWHLWRTGHRGWWSEHMIWSGASGRVFFCEHCGEQFWPRDAPYEDWRDNPVRRTRPED
jgi:hypothetical protein